MSTPGRDVGHSADDGEEIIRGGHGRILTCRIALAGDRGGLAAKRLTPAAGTTEPGYRRILAEQRTECVHAVDSAGHLWQPKIVVPLACH